MHLLQQGSGLKSIHNRHGEIEHDEIRFVPSSIGNCLLTVLRLRAYETAGFEHTAQSLTYPSIVIDEQNRVEPYTVSRIYRLETRDRRLEIRTAVGCRRRSDRNSEEYVREYRGCCRDSA